MRRQHFHLDTLLVVGPGWRSLHSITLEPEGRVLKTHEQRLQWHPFLHALGLQPNWDWCGPGPTPGETRIRPIYIVFQKDPSSVGLGRNESASKNV